MKRALYLFTFLVVLTILPSFTFAANLRAKKIHHAAPTSQPNLSLISKTNTLLKSNKAQAQNTNTVQSTSGQNLITSIKTSVRNFIYGTLDLLSSRCDTVPTNCRFVRFREVCDYVEVCN